MQRGSVASSGHDFAMIFDWAIRLRRHPASGGASRFSFRDRPWPALRGFNLLPPGFPFLTFFPAIMLTAFIGGTRPGILCAVLSVLSAWYWFIPPFMSFVVDTRWSSPWRSSSRSSWWIC